MLLAIGHLTIDHASLSRRSTVPTPNRDTSNIWALITFFPRYIETFCSSYPLPVSPSVATIYLQDNASFSRIYLVYQTSLCHICLFSSSLTHPVPPRIFHSLEGRDEKHARVVVMVGCVQTTSCFPQPGFAEITA